MNRVRRLSPSRVILLTIFLVISVGLVLVLSLPIEDNTRFAVIVLAVVGTAYYILIADRMFDRSRFWKLLIPVLNTAIITLASFLLHRTIPMIPILYLIAIAAVSIHGGLVSALWSAALATVGHFLVVIFSNTSIPWIDSIALTAAFFFIGVLTGALAEHIQHRTRELEAAITAHQRGHREQEAERAVAHAVSRTLDLNQVLNLALDQSLAALPFDAGAIFLADDAQTTLTLAGSRGIADSTRARLYAFGEGVTGTAAARREVIVSESRAEISVPLIARDGIVGVLNLSAEKSKPIGDEDIALLRAISVSIAIAIDHARLFETLEQRVEERTAKLAALNRIIQVASQSLDLDASLNAALEELITTLNVPGAWIRLLDTESGLLVLRADIGDKTMYRHRQAVRIGEGMSGLVAQDHHPRAVNLEESDLTNREAMLVEGYRSVGAVPLMVEEKLIGVMGVASEKHDHFGAAELLWLSSVANALAVTVENARLFQSVERQVAQLATLREIDRTLNSMLDLTPMLETLLVRLAQVTPYDSAAVLLLEGNFLRAVAARGRDETALRDFALDISNNVIFQRMARTHAPMIIDNIGDDPDWVKVRAVEFGRAWLGAPLIARGELIGQIGLFSTTPRAFTRAHSDLLLAFANHAAITIANTRLRAELREQARRDSLTGVLNHGAFITELRRAGEDACLGNQPLALIMLDLDDFKSYNDTYGHVVGDMVLTVMVQAIRAHIHQSDFVGRWGGEEFGIALLDTDPPRAQMVAARIRATLAETPIVNARDALAHIPPPTASQGIAAIPVSARDVDELIERADRALYHAKNRGKDQVVVAESNSQVVG